MKTRLIRIGTFIYMNVTNEAHKLFGILEMYRLYEDNSESLIESIDDLFEALNSGDYIVVEVGHIHDNLLTETN